MKDITSLNMTMTCIASHPYFLWYFIISSELIKFKGRIDTQVSRKD